MENKQTPQGFAQARLPWLVGAGALVLFLVTLNIWVNIRSLPIVAKVTGWDWTPPLQLPLFYLLTYPFRLLPEGIQPIALNVLTAMAAALTLALLARSVALLPHDRTHEQRIRERSEFSLLSTKWNWLPPLLAVLVCGLQLTFWEHATAATGEALDLLIFAYCIRCLLEYRIDRRESWLVRLAFVYGLGATNNWALIGFFPLFLAAIIWIKGASFFRGKFIIRMLLAGMLGLLLYLFIPILWATTHPDTTFWEVFKLVLGTQKSYLAAQPLRQPALVLALTSILPLIVMGIRWPSTFGDTSAFGAMLTNILFRVVHLVFLGACLWMAFDQAFSPRKIGKGLPFLTFYYLGALAVGYYSAYALLVFTDVPRKPSHRPSGLMKLLNPIIRGVVLLAAILVPIALAVRNFPAVQASNGKLLRDFAAFTSEQLPNGQTILISDDSFQAVLMRGFLNKAGKGADYILVDSRGLETPGYHLELSKKHGDRWPKLPFDTEPGTTLNPLFVQQFVGNLVRSNRVAYLHPSFGYYFEQVYPQANGVVYPLAAYDQQAIIPAPKTPEAIQKNTAFWSKADGFIGRVQAARNQDSLDPVYISQFYSRALNNWGVEVQREKMTEQAKGYFQKAAQLNSNNIPAAINLEFSEQLASGKQIDLSAPINIEEKLGAYRTWGEVMRENGPFDEPRFCMEVGRVLLGQGLFRQGMQNLYRVVSFQPTNFLARTLLIRGLIYGGWTDQGLQELAQARQNSPAMDQTQQLELISLESIAHFNKKDQEKAEQVLVQAEKTFPDHPTLLAAKFDLYRAAGETNKALEALEHQLKLSKTNLTAQMQKAELFVSMERVKEADEVLSDIITRNPTFMPAILYKAFVAIETTNYDAGKELTERALRIDPENEQALIYRAIIEMENKKFDSAISTLNIILDREKDHLAALRNRAIAHLRAEHWEEAREDYEHLQRLAPSAFAVYYGLAKVADNTKRFSEAIKNYELYLKYFDRTGAAESLELQKERKEVEDRLRELKARQK